jgi:hypothetical protein
MIIAMCISVCLDEKRNEKKNTAALGSVEKLAMVEESLPIS